MIHDEIIKFGNSVISSCIKFLQSLINASSTIFFKVVLTLVLLLMLLFLLWFYFTRSDVENI